MTLSTTAKQRHETLQTLLNQSKTLDAKFVHNLRVATRRLSEVAAILAAKPVRTALKNLRKSASELRDLDVTCEHLNQWPMPKPLKTLAKELIAEMQEKRSDLEKKLRKAMTSADVTKAMTLLSKTIATAPASTPAIEKRLSKRQKQLQKKYATAARLQTDESLHAARIATKQLRYILELTTPRPKPELKFLKDVQELLGDHHDVHVILSTLSPRVTAKGLTPVWQKWRQIKEREQSERAAEFFKRDEASSRSQL
ncbi:MAG: CHAD domain-containing protein [Phycisphaerales bacterium]|nr:CHAD domain-containing protein [Phycisphaerales bacterium]